MIEDIKSFFWFIVKGPKFYSTLFALILTKFKPVKDSDKHIQIATKWCKENISTIDECLLNIGIREGDLALEEAFSKDYKAEISKIIDTSSSNFGGPGHTNLLYTICEKLNIKNVIETGVAYGWSSASILKSISKRNGKLISIDMPMLKQTDYELIGVAVEKNLKKKASKNFMAMQKGDVHSTLSDSSLLKRITGYNPKTKYQEGIKKFVKWYLDYVN